MALNNRLELRLTDEEKARAALAAGLVGENLSAFVRNAVNHRADTVLSEHTTRVPAAFFDELCEELREAGVPIETLTRAFTRARAVVRQREDAQSIAAPAGQSE